MDRGQLLNRSSPDVRDDLAVRELAVALRGPGRDRFRGLPLVDPREHMVADRELGRLDIGAAADGRNQLGELDFSLAFRAVHGDVLDVALASLRIARALELQAPRRLTAALDVPGAHLSSSPRDAVDCIGSAP